VENNDDIEIDNDISASEDEDDRPHFKPFAPRLAPAFVEHCAFVPPYPKTHEDGYAIVVELPDVAMTKEKIRKLRQAMQYTLTGGGGEKKVQHVPYFEIEGDESEDISMTKTIRQCAGVKVSYRPRKHGADF
jgi:hypothetical protein